MNRALLGKERRGFGAGPDLRRSAFGALTLLLALPGCRLEQLPPEDREAAADAAGAVTAAEREIRAIEDMLHSSAGSWNAGDLDGFMDDYWRSVNLSFSGSGGVTRGWERVRQRYLDSYWAPGATRDSLRFEELEVTLLGDAHALVLGRYVLYRPEDEEVTSTGFFSLVLRQVEGEWWIIHDHTSASPPDEGEGASSGEEEGER